LFVVQHATTARRSGNLKGGLVKKSKAPKYVAGKNGLVRRSDKTKAVGRTWRKPGPVTVRHIKEK